MPAIAPQPAPKHAALIWLIRGTEGVLVGLSFLLMLLIGLSFIFQLNPFLRPQLYSVYFSVPMLAIILLVAAYMIWKNLHNRSKARGELSAIFWNVNRNHVSNFAFVFAALTAYDFYHLMPPHPPQFSHAHPMAMLLSRDAAIFVFWILWPLLKFILVRVLELNAPGPLQNQPPSDPAIPQFPQKSPLIPL